MAKYKQISYGSKGSDVTELQKLLNSTGNYNLAEDGDFGDKTRAAVEDYQRKNGLTVDGIAGDNTWGSLKGGSVTGFKPGATATTMGSSGGTAQTTSFNYGDYEASDAVKQAEAMLQEQMNNKPGEYQSSWQTQLDEIMGQILNRQPFEYDLNGDALYQQYKDQAVQQGRMVMMDTMGQAAALTGGYGSSYAQSVGQQAYQNHLQGLNDVIPELYQLALDKYTQDGQNLLDQFAMIGAREDQDYGRYRDSVSDFYTELDRLTDNYRDERDTDYGRWADGRDFAYGQERDRIADEQWQKEFDEAKRQYDQSYALSASKSSSSSGGSSGGSSSKKSSGTNSQKQSTTMTDYQKTEAMLINGGYNSAQMLQIIRSSPLSKEEQDALIAQYQKPLQKQEVEEASNKRRNDGSAYWGSR